MDVLVTAGKRLKKERKTLCALLIGIMCLLTACGQKVPTEPAALPPIKGTEPPAQAAITEPTTGLNFGSIGHGPDKCEVDESGSYISYAGGEMAVPYEITARGLVSEKPIGILLFLGGQPQPYHTAEDPEDRYLHYFSVNKDGPMLTDFIFTPICGQTGDDLDLYGINVNDPEYTPREGIAGFKHTVGSVSSSTRIKFLETPPEVELPPLTEIESYTLAEQPVKVTDLPVGWTDESWDTGLEIQWFLDGDPMRTWFWNYSSENDGHLHAEFFGTSLADYGVTVFVDNQPVSFDGSHYLPIILSRGQKQVLDVKLDLQDFSGEQTVYAVFAPRNARTCAMDTYATPQTSGTFYLLEGENPCAEETGK